MKLALIGCVAGLFFSASLRAELEPVRPGDSTISRYKFPAYVPIEEVPGLPRVLLIGDSISIGYTLPVRARLKDRANVIRPSENCADTGTGLKRLDTWLAIGGGTWDVIHFNFGLHDLKYLDEQGHYVAPDKGTQVTSPLHYEANLRALVRRLKKTGARLIFATTTPVPAGAAGRIEDDAVRFNEIARRVMREEEVAVNDLFVFAVQRQSQIQLPKNVHFTPEGYEKLAEMVAERIMSSLTIDKKR